MRVAARTLVVLVISASPLHPAARYPRQPRLPRLTSQFCARTIAQEVKQVPRLAPQSPHVYLARAVGSLVVSRPSRSAEDRWGSPERCTSVGKTTRAAVNVAAEPITSSRPRLQTPRWCATSKLPKPDMVVRPLNTTPRTGRRASRGPPPCADSRDRRTMFTPYSAAEPMMRGNAQTFTRLN